MERGREEGAREVMSGIIDRINCTKEPSAHVIDTSFDFRSDSRGHDPDQHSPTLRRYHKHLWSKPLSSGRPFVLDDTTPGGYLHHRSDVGEFWLASDSVVQTFTRWFVAQPIIATFPPVDVEQLKTTAYTKRSGLSPQNCRAPRVRASLRDQDRPNRDRRVGERAEPNKSEQPAPRSSRAGHSARAASGLRGGLLSAA